MKDFMRVSKVVVGAALTAELLTGCATRYCGGCGPESSFPKQTAEHNAKTLEVAIDNTSARLIKTLQASLNPDGTLAKGFNLHTTTQAIGAHINTHLPAPTVLLGENDCVKKRIVEATVWGLEASLEGTKQSEPLPTVGVGRPTIFGNTWANIKGSCGIKETERYQQAVQESWNRTAVILDKLNFEYK